MRCRCLEQLRAAALQRPIVHFPDDTLAASGITNQWINADYRHQQMINTGCDVSSGRTRDERSFCSDVRQFPRTPVRNLDQPTSVELRVRDSSLQILHIL